jgi:hypothetical protein
MKQVENELAIARSVLRDVALLCVDEGFGTFRRKQLKDAAANYRRLVHESEKGMENL